MEGWRDGGMQSSSSLHPPSLRPSTPAQKVPTLPGTMATHTADVAAPVERRAWTIEESRSLYNVEGWGAGFFDINERGHVVVRPDRGRPERELDLAELATDLSEQGIGLPV